MLGIELNKIIPDINFQTTIDVYIWKQKIESVLTLFHFDERYFSLLIIQLLNTNHKQNIVNIILNLNRNAIINSYETNQKRFFGLLDLLTKNLGGKPHVVQYRYALDSVKLYTSSINDIKKFILFFKNALYEYELAMKMNNELCNKHIRIHLNEILKKPRNI